MNKHEQYFEKNVYEQELYDSGYITVAGIDEVGRGPLAGPVTIGFVILDRDNPIYGLKDSKKLSKKQIELFASEIYQKAKVAFTVDVRPQTIDKIGIRNAVHFAMKKAVKQSPITPDFVLIDYEQVDFGKVPAKGIVHGDDVSNSIAAASIIAKHKRDKYMVKLSCKYPEYGFNTNVGYGTKEHLIALEKFGPIEKVHRYTFKPIRKD